MFQPGYNAILSRPAIRYRSTRGQSKWKSRLLLLLLLLLLLTEPEEEGQTSTWSRWRLLYGWIRRNADPDMIFLLFIFICNQKMLLVNCSNAYIAYLNNTYRPTQIQHVYAYNCILNKHEYIIHTKKPIDERNANKCKQRRRNQPTW